MALETVSILDGSEFVVSDRRGDLEATPTDNHGLFLDDTRFLSRWVLTINGQRPTLLSVDDTSYYRVQYFLALATGAVYIDSQLAVVRQRSVHGGFHEVLALENYGKTPLDLDIRIEVGADFADLFEVKEKRSKQGELYRQVADDRLTLGYRRDQYRRETVVTSSEPAAVSQDAFRFKVHLDPHSQWSTTLDVRAVRRPEIEAAPTIARSLDDWSRPDLAANLRQWLDGAPKVFSSWEPLEHIYRRSLVDLAALRFRTPLLLAVDARRRPALVHGDLWPGQPADQLPGPAVRP